MSEILNDLSAVPDGALDAVLLKSVEMPEGTPTVRGYDFEGPLDLQKMLDCMMTSGYQATQFGRCVDEASWETLRLMTVADGRAKIVDCGELDSS